MFCSVEQLAKAKGVSPQAIREGISLGRYDAIQVGRDWRIFGIGGIHDKIKRTRARHRCTQPVWDNYDYDRAFHFSTSLKESSGDSIRKRESQPLLCSQ